MTLRRAASPASLADPGTLAKLLAPGAGVRVTPMPSIGFSGSRLSRVSVRAAGEDARSYVLKRTSLAEDWLATLTGDREGREEAWLHEPAFADAARAFALPYALTAREPGAHALLMDDLSQWLFPDVREPLAITHEDALLDALATLHAAFWERTGAARDWLAAPEALLDLLGPRRVADPAGLDALPGPMRERVVEGWRIAFEALPAAIADALARPASALLARIGPLPRTLVHGDVKVANFARMPDGRIAAFDWALVGWAPAFMDLGWSLAVNATRFARPREAWLETYRERLEARLGRALDPGTWRRTVDGSVLAGARMLLWSKAAAMRSGGERERAEWAWWETRLAAAAARTGGS